MNNPMPNMNPFMAAMQMAQNGKNPMQMLQQIMGSNPQFNQVMRVINSKDPAFQVPAPYPYNNCGCGC